MKQELPAGGYLELPLRMSGGRLVTCALDESVRRFLQLNLNVPEQGKHRPRWMPADPAVGCRVPHYDFDVLSRAVGSDTAKLVGAIKHTTSAIEPRVSRVDVEVADVPPSDTARRRRDGTTYKGPMKRVLIRCERVDGGRQTLHYDVTFGGTGPVFEDQD